MLEASEISLEKGLQNNLEQSSAIVEKAKAKLDAGSPIIDEIAQLKKTAENIKASHLLIQEKFKLKEDAIKTLGAKAIERHQVMSEGYKKALAEYLNLIESLTKESSQQSALSNQQQIIENLKTLLDKILHKKKRPIIGSLPYRNINYPSKEPDQSASIKPAYKGGNKVVSPDDTKSTEEAPISQEIAALAQTLNWNPVLIYEYVKNNIETEWYWGCMKGSEETLRQKSGNDCDHATLLTALLRASGFPARYVRGTMEFFAGGRDGNPMERAKNLTGIEDPIKIAEFFQKSGIPFKPLIHGGRIANFQFEHVWVETQVPYGNYRGVIIDDSDKRWLGLDTSIKAKDYQYNSPIDIYEQSALSPQLPGIRDEYLGTMQTQTPLEYLEEKITANGNQPSEIMRTRTLSSEIMNILPASMQMDQKRITHEYTAIPEELKHKVNITATDASSNNELFSMTLDTLKLINRKIAMTYEPETVEDQEIIDSYGGLDNTPAYLIRLRPVLKVDDERIIVGKDGLPMGAEYNLSIELISPNGTEKVNSAQVIGNLSVIGIGAGKVTPSNSPLPQEGEGDKDAEQLLYEEALNYIDRWNQAEDELASLLHLTITRPIPTVVTVGGVIDVIYVLDTPHGFEWKGVYVDAALRSIGVTPAVSPLPQEGEGERQKTFMQLSALQGSVLENRIFEDDFGVDSISTVKLFELANSNQIPIITIDKTNISTILPTLLFDDNIKADITNAVNQNFAVNIPQSEITYQDWTGIGYIKENPETGEAGYMLSGMIAGGMTALNKVKWINTDIANELSNPYSANANNDPESAVKVVRLAKYKTDYEEGIVGTTLPNPFEVMVQDRAGKAVQNVSVTFKVIAGGGKVQGLDESTPAPEITVKTGSDGIAKVNHILGQKTSDSPYYVYGSPNAVLIGQNLVSVNATTKSRGKIYTDKPFEAYGLPGATAKIDIPTGYNFAGYPNMLSGAVQAKVVDQYDNPISNKKVIFTVQPQEYLGILPTGTTQNAKVFKELTDCPWVPTLDCPNAVDTLNIVTDSLGTLAYVILGNTESTKFTIKAIANKDIFEGTTRKETQETIEADIILGTTTLKNDDKMIKPFTTVAEKYTTDGNGHKIDAGAPGTQFNEPLTAAMDLIEEDYDRVGTPGNYYLKGKGTFKVSPVTNGTMTFGVFAGDGSISQSSQTGSENGQYSTILTLGKTPALNKVNAVGLVKVQVPEVNPATGVITTKEWNAASQTTFEVWGVTATIETNQLILINKDGYPTADTTIRYTILPVGYKPQDMYLEFYEKDKNGSEVGMGIIQADSSGNLILSQGGAKFDLQNTYTGELILNGNSLIEIKSEKKAVDIAYVYIEQDDPEFPNSNLRWNDYYPALGDKTITIRAIESGNIQSSNRIRYEVISPTPAEINQLQTPATITLTPQEATFINGKAEFTLSGRDLAPRINNDLTTGIDKISLKFTYTTLSGASVDLFANYNIKNNYNTTLGEVLSGEAVFVHDENTADNHAGKTEAGVTGDNDKKLDFVQELLNQVVPRKRNIYNPADPGVSYTYTLTEEDGNYNSYTYNGLIDFKFNFNLNVNTVVGPYTQGPDGIGLYSSNKAEDDTSITFRRLMKDYGKKQVGDKWLIDGANNDKWLHKIIDKETLVGNVQRIPAPAENLTSDNDDSLINQTNGNTRNDTGLYELYKNTVVRFVNGMIEQAEHFAGERGTPGVDAPTLNWYARTGEGPTGCWPGTTCSGVHGSGMSYCFGCKNSIAEFNINKVANCKAETTTVIKNRETDIVNGNEYRGNIGNNCAIGTGTLDWAGLYSEIPGQEEYDLYARCVDRYNTCITQNSSSCSAVQRQQLISQCSDDLRSKARAFNPAYWAGIDCSGLVQKDINSGRAATVGTRILPLSDRGSQQYFTGYSDVPGSDLVLYLENPAEVVARVQLQKKLKKGDIVRYRGHISTVYSEKPTCDNTTCAYAIIHASGSQCIDINGNRRCDQGDHFNRKVVINSTQLYRTNPTGFGRIKLWD